jgi:hypothetical protein
MAITDDQGDARWWVARQLRFEAFMDALRESAALMDDRADAAGGEEVADLALKPVGRRTHRHAPVAFS